MDSRKVGKPKLTGIRPAISQAPKTKNADDNFNRFDLLNMKLSFRNRFKGSVDELFHFDRMIFEDFKAAAYQRKRL